MEMAFVLCRILTEFFCIIWVNLVLKCPWHGWPFTKKAHIPSQVSPCGICGEQRGTGTDLYVFSLHLNTTIKRRTNRQSLGIFKQSSTLFQLRGSIWQKSACPLFSLIKGIIWCLGCDPCTCFPCCWQPFTVVSTTGKKLTHQTNYMEGSPFWEVCYCSPTWVPVIVRSLKFSSVMSQKNVHFCHPVSSRSVLIFPSQECPGIQSGILTQ